MPAGRRVALVLSSVLTVAVAACAPSPSASAISAETPQAAAPEFINLVDPWPYPFSSAVKTGGLIFVSGQIGTVVREGQPVLVEGGIEPEARQAMENIKAVVERAGSSMDRVVKCTVMLADMAEWPAFNTIYAGYFPGPKPARAAWGATALALGARVEVDCIAAAR
ncbi:MAG: Rid family hydrolase [Vicinamibacterales bacterium]